MTMAKIQQKHIHKLKKLKFKSGTSTFFCTLPDCVFKINPSMALGKRSICWRCGESFIMNEYSLRLSKPHCGGCHKPKNDKQSVIIELHNNDLTLIINQEPTLAERLNKTLHFAKQEEDI